MPATVVFDIGKTNVKLTLLAADGATLAEERCPNTVVNNAPYPHHDTERIWDWLLAKLAGFARQASIGAIVPVTHGATAALVNDSGLVLPVLDYEAHLPQSAKAGYSLVRPAFGDTFSPDLPVGLNLGRQLYWLATTFPDEFSRARHILMYPQYWAWRLCGVAASEVTSLGCHTDLWNPLRATLSSLVDRMGWDDLFPPRQTAWSRLGPLLPDLALGTGLPSDCKILCGIHDSNASLLRHLGTDVNAAPRTVLSTGTWVIAAAIGKPLTVLKEQSDMLANVSATGLPIACIRFMGGREFSVLAGPSPQIAGMADFEHLIAQGTLALPCFAESGGPFVGQPGTIAGPAPQTAEERYALATMYCVLMTDFCLSELDAEGPIVVEGSFTSNPFFSTLLASLRDGQPVAFSNDASGTTCGGWMLHHLACVPDLHCETAIPVVPSGWIGYCQRWRAMVGEHRRPAESHNY